MRPLVSSQHSRPPYFLFSGRQEDALLLREWLLVLKGDGRSPRTIGNYRESVGMLASFLAAGGFPLLTNVTAEHVREWLNQTVHRQHPLPRRQRLLQVAGQSGRSAREPHGAH